MTGLQLDNAMPSGVSGGYRSPLPSFDDLMRSLDLSPSASASSSSKGHHHHINQTPHHHHHAMHAHPHPYPYPHHSASPHHLIHRPPSTPPTPTSDDAQDYSQQSGHGDGHDHKSAKHVHHKGKHAGRPRSSSVPPVSKTHLASPFRDLHGLSPSPHGEHEHHASRIQSLKEGDGEWAPYSLNAVAPSSLPYVDPRLAFPPPLARSATLPSKGVDGIHPYDLFPGEPLAFPISRPNHGGYERGRKHSFILPLPVADVDVDECSDRDEQQHLLTPPPSPPLLPIPLPDDSLSLTLSYSASNDHEYARHKRSDTCAYSTDTAAPSYFESLPLTTQYLGAPHAKIDSAIIRGRKRRYGDTDGVGLGYEHGHGHGHETGPREGINANAISETNATVHKAQCPIRTWHWIESQPPHQPRLSTSAYPQVQNYSDLDDFVRPIHNHNRNHKHEDTLIAEAILRHLLKAGEKRSWSMI
ncbi:hypothetical protein IAU59_006137 [Kwoniella sp. CBS 9459]